MFWNTKSVFTHITMGMLHQASTVTSINEVHVMAENLFTKTYFVWLTFACICFRYNGTVFAYGATGAGKTHTMVGDHQQPGIMIRALNDLFHAVKDKEHQYSVYFSKHFHLLQLNFTQFHVTTETFSYLSGYDVVLGNLQRANSWLT